MGPVSRLGVVDRIPDAEPRLFRVPSLDPAAVNLSVTAALRLLEMQMTRSKIRNAVMLAIAAFAGSVEAPKLAHAPLAAAADLADAPSAISGAVTRVADNVTGSHLGFDTNVYPGAKAMAAWKRSDLYEWVGY